ncbi:aspartyl-phosphate phosphatase Spo0E family protein [Salibacterium halotolerans]|uniref:Spo0E like sporulation regulatory protein n=1 Tax=Salibacterium halotolerans TaxID=1884432 RepID=A0A1I5XQ78_9BACI|nr:aspartyl-phosphate phosphatase Spo0E family protein [Salibacterium halotolerans]SFQ34112.1 Spo0E like sporulation regulatory protein [Salibacterium halotolerans]
MSEQLLLREIEIKREKLHSKACSQSLFSEEVIRLSRELDHLLNMYDGWYHDRKSAAPAN